MEKIRISPADGLKIKKPNSPEFYQAGDEVVVTRAVTKLLRDGDLIPLTETIETTETKKSKRPSKDN